VHTSNQYLDLEPVVANAARHFNFKMATINYDEDADDNDDEGDWWVYSSTWILLTRNEEIIHSPAISQRRAVKPPCQHPTLTDDFASLFQILN
jgi:hypothetical protein